MARKQSDQIVETPTEARQAEPGPSVLWLLVISLCLAFHSGWGLVRVLSHLMEPADQGGSLIHLCHRKSDHRRCVFRKGMPAAARIPLAIGSHPP